MKKLKYLMIALVIMSSCTGEDGQDGTSYVALDWVGTIYYEDDIYSTPSNLSSGHYYKTTPGSYSFSYVHELTPNILWESSIRVEKDEGTEGAFLEDGIDGDDFYYLIGLWSDGPQVYKYLEPQYFKKSAQIELLENSGSSIIPVSELLNIDVSSLEPVAEVSSSITVGSYVIHCDAQKYQFETGN